jgi:hypothetical protein
MRDSDTRHGNRRLGKITGTVGEPTIKNSGKTDRRCCFNGFR